jgi:hypothetical protein
MSMSDLLQALPYPDRDEQRVHSLVRALHEEGMVYYEAGEDVLDLPS